MTDKFAGVEIAGVENDGLENAGLETGRLKNAGWKLADWKMTEWHWQNGKWEFLVHTKTTTSRPIKYYSKYCIVVYYCLCMYWKLFKAEPQNQLVC